MEHTAKNVLSNDACNSTIKKIMFYPY